MPRQCEERNAFVRSHASVLTAASQPCCSHQNGAAWPCARLAREIFHQSRKLRRYGELALELASHDRHQPYSSLRPAAAVLSFDFLFSQEAVLVVTSDGLGGYYYYAFSK